MKAKPSDWVFLAIWPGIPTFALLLGLTVEAFGCEPITSPTATFVESMREHKLQQLQIDALEKYNAEPVWTAPTPPADFPSVFDMGTTPWWTQ